MPFLVRFPGRIQPGSVNKDMVLNVDFGPTFLDLAGLPVPKEMQGRSIRPLLEGKTPADWRKSMYYHYYEYPGAHMVHRHYGVRTETHKLIYFYELGEWELYDLEKDPNELKSVYSDPAYAPVVQELKAELERLRKELGDTEEFTPKRDARAPLPGATGVQLHLTFDEAPAAKAAKSLLPPRRALTYHGTQSVPGRTGKARRFNGTSDYLELDRPDCPSPARTPITVSAWVQPSKPDGVLLAHGGSAQGYCLHLDGGKAAFSTRISAQLTTVAAPEKLPEGWVHVAGHLAKDGTLTVYVNGKAAATAKASGLLPQDPHEGLQVGVDAGSTVAAKADNYFGGLLDELKLTYGDGSEKHIAEAAKAP
jgi:hypothetical protein